MLQAVKHYPDYQFIIAQAPSQPDELYTSIIGNQQVQLAKGQTYNLLKQATAALVTSGTATLETELFGVPQVVCYKGNPISYWLAKKLIKVKYIPLVNLIMDKPVITELIQADLNETMLKQELDKILLNKEHISKLKAEYAQLWHLLGNSNASENAAEAIVGMLR
eukprot:Opistho-1_new@17463